MESLYRKSESDLSNQIDEVSGVLGTEIIPESKKQEVLGMSLEEIQEKYPERYKVYVDTLIARKAHHEVDTGDFEEMRIWIQALNNLDTYIEGHAPKKEEFDARTRRQLTVFEDVRDHLEKGEKEGYVKLPTGVGKTVLFSKITESLDLKTLIVVPSKILITQTGEKLEEFTDLDFGKYFQGEKNLNENVTITTYLSLVRAVKDGTIDPSKYGALILDEAHKALGEETTKVIEQFNAVKLGFTATPKYSKDKHVSDLLEHEMHSMTIIEAAQEKLVSRFKSYIAYTDTDISAVKIKDKEKYNEDELEKVIDKESRNRSAVELYKQQFEGHLAIAYCGGVSHAEHVAEMFVKDGIKAEVISGDTPDEEKTQILERFSTGETKVLCNARILIEGFDEPKASVCLNLHPTLSLVDAEQRAGRVLRLDPSNPDKWGYVVDFVDKGAKVPPLTFAEIAQASEVDGENAITFEDLRSNGLLADNEEKNNRTPISNIEIEGLKVVVDAQEVLRVGFTFEEERNREKENFIEYDILKDAVVNAGIKTQQEYISVYKTYTGWPSNPQQYYSEWEGWPAFLSKEYRNYIDFKTFKEELLASGIKSSSEYYNKYKKYKGWPGAPYHIYDGKGWKGWDDIFGREKKEFLSYSELISEVRSLGIKTKDKYTEEYKKHSNWPSMPQNKYSKEGWISWAEFLGTIEKIDSLEQVKSEVQKLQIQSSTEYSKIAVDHPNWPSAPQHVYKEWIDWYDFLGKERQELLNLSTLKDEIKNLGITTQKQYQIESRKHPSWPADPYSRFKNQGWVSWPDLFGKEYRNHLPFDQFKDEVKRAGVKNRNQYRNTYKQHSGWPAIPENVYKDKGWISWAELLN